MAANLEALKPDDSSDRFMVANSEQLGMVGTLLQNIQPDPGANLRVLLDRNLRQSAIAKRVKRSPYSNQGHPTADVAESVAGRSPASRRSQRTELIRACNGQMWTAADTTIG